MHWRKGKTQSEEQSLRTSPRRGEVLAPRDWEFNTPMVTMLRSPLENVGNAQEQVSVRSRETETLSKNGRKILGENLSALDWTSLGKESVNLKIRL